MTNTSHPCSASRPSDSQIMCPVNCGFEINVITYAQAACHCDIICQIDSSIELDRDSTCDVATDTVGTRALLRERISKIQFRTIGRC